MLKRCDYCHKVFDGEKGDHFCSKECADTFDALARADARKARFLLYAMVLGLICMGVGTFFVGRELTGVGVLLVGLAFIFCPFATPNMIQIFGYQRARLVIRIVGVVALVFGAYVGWFAA
ncbi:MAG: hypothetical protein UDB11_09790 [Peptococcaceae bacterium]|nr:hypothetical protein [Peptococcaceae bacterium]